jgi:nicotinate-nucleotide adenylyltransferase
MKYTGNSVITSRQQLDILAPCRIAFLGGSFNPIHAGHIAMAEYVLKNHVDYVVLCPHSLHPNKKDILVHFEHRINMILILKDISSYSRRIFTFDPSFIEGTYGEHFISLCNQLQNINCYVSIICGVDCFSRTYCGELCQFDHYIGIRDTHYSEKEISSLIKGNVTFFETPFASLSSTKVRSGVSEKKNHEIHEQLFKYIDENRLFLS